MTERAEVPDLIKAKEAASILQVPLHHLYAITQEGKIPCYRYSQRLIKYDRAEVIAYLHSLRCPAKGVSNG